MKTLAILYEDEEILIIEKPFGLAVQGGAGIVHSLDNLLSEQIGAKIFPVHRLDKDTAGLLAAAKSAAAAAKWTRLIASAEVTKEYTALCRGLPPKQRGIFTSEVGKKGAIKSAATNYGVLKTAAQEDGFVFSLLRLTLETGRTHQIRIHLANAGCPIVGDDKYGDFQANRAIRKVYGIKKLQLAAVRLTVPLEGQKRTFTIPLPEHIQSAAELLFLV